MGKPASLTRWARVFLTPTNATHRQYEALRAYFVDRVPGTEVARRFGYTPGSFRVLVHQFRRRPDRSFFATPAMKVSASRQDPVHQRIVTLRKQNQSIYDISDSLKKEGVRRSVRVGGRGVAEGRVCAASAATR